ncbi:nicotinate-nucleotide--dimethylbenzimidazole phosphoribosyltransferase [Aurantimonas sp. C2-6-R+9]|uniref:nicotinate-nucleotide--dimethylbenzimidazole phosphoribosyltransferase n=1 Tax=unclassified Aurantimonas TaxID=2638230 RepID=UPI002E18C7E2|nr:MULTISPECIES: nicotinate-nucleotide--dimethylbenzimidazole phosphoribosyltransferase [unclassified Aurantimonas]MEC5289794.1 nicotinate-nucleotide--dimethylbenzimidazole phosphoribosyltransferase [Aurantimonas sp. C2-3-R2]MEC5379761.1 nicotinate-nucleotide--dimethylbenzimidazole phosphoribosyltransferase [Aurantimonas sp. C2-6-R+9]MEC5410767.1 nicotinate-nucleotide--dimethylbenzimidazole phosphoribosyltransferase [Aurantimonas sp. C2-4-R8]
MSTTGLPFDDIRDLVRRMPGPDEAAVRVKREREGQLTKPAGALGRLEDISEWLAAWQGRQPAVRRPLVAVFAGNHGVTRQGVSPFPAEVTAQMVANFAAGGAAINQICAAYDLGLKVFDLALELPTEDITEAAAMDERTCAATMAFGMEVLAGEPDLLCIGEMGIGNTTIAAAIFAALFGGDPSDWTGPGAGHDATGVDKKARVVAAALEHHKGHLADPLEVLRRLGGREIAAMAGAILAARMQKVPVIVDGFVSTAAAAILYAMDPKALDHCLFGHVSAEPGHIRAVEAMGKVPLLALGMRLGEGTGAAIAAGIVKAAAECHSGMATFGEAAVSNRE